MVEMHCWNACCPFADTAVCCGTALRTPGDGPLRPGRLGHAFCKNAVHGDCPASLTMLFETTSALGMFGGPAMNCRLPPGLALKPSAPFGSMPNDLVTGVMKCGLTQSLTENRATMKP